MDSLKKNIAVLIRVYNRIDDLEYCLSILRDTWTSNSYYVIVVFNGQEDGYRLSAESKKKIDRLVIIPNNIGHFSGNSELLLAGLPHIPVNCAWTVILEADTWLYGDALLEKYIPLMSSREAVWASAQFFRYALNLATDFAIVNTGFIKKHPEVFRFERTPEYDVANYLDEHKHGFMYIRENMPVNLPRYISRYPFAPTGRFFSFPKGKMVTHHIETLKKGIEEKKAEFNMVAGTPYFNVPGRPAGTLFFLKLFTFLTVFIPYKAWFVKRKRLTS